MMQVLSVLWKRDWYFYNTIFETLLLTSKCFNSFKKGIKALGLKIIQNVSFLIFAYVHSFWCIATFIKQKCALYFCLKCLAEER